MTILNVHIRADRALVGMDTEILNTADGSRFGASKFGVIPEANVLMCWRGDRNLHGLIYAECFLAREYIDFDALERILPEVLGTLRAQYKSNCASAGVPAEVLDHEIANTIDLILVGWSTQRGRICGQRFSQPSGSERPTVEEISESVIAPGEILAPHEVLVPQSISAMEKLAKNQLGAARRAGVVDQGFGGSFLLVEVMRHELRIRRREIFK